jgi:hypothetical protein
VRRHRSVTNIPDRGRTAVVIDTLVLAQPICLAHVHDDTSGTTADYDNVRELELMPPGRPLTIGRTVTLTGTIARGSSNSGDVFFLVLAER